MPTATMTSKGQVTIPARVRAELRLMPGTKISFEKNVAGETVLVPKTGDVRQLKGFFNYKGPAKTLKQIDEGIAAAVAERAGRK